MEGDDAEQAETQARATLAAEDVIDTGRERQESMAGMLRAEPDVVQEEVHLLEGLPSAQFCLGSLVCLLFVQK